MTITSPGSGSTVAGTIAVRANASDDRGVAGVQFRLNRANLGAEDVAAPYAVSWDTTTTRDGSYTLTAVARDAAGNLTTSAVTITVSNAPPPPPRPSPPPPPAAMRFEETDRSIAYTGDWNPTDPRPWSGATAAYSEMAGARATFAFTGTSVRWIGFRGTQTGIALVSLDGRRPVQVDTYSPTEEVQAVLFIATSLADTSHTLTIEVTGGQNPASIAAYIVVDAFDVTP